MFNEINRLARMEHFYIKELECIEVEVDGVANSTTDFKGLSKEEVRKARTAQRQDGREGKRRAHADGVSMSSSVAGDNSAQNVLEDTGVGVRLRRPHLYSFVNFMLTCAQQRHRHVRVLNDGIVTFRLLFATTMANNYRGTLRTSSQCTPGCRCRLKQCRDRCWKKLLFTAKRAS